MIRSLAEADMWRSVAVATAAALFGLIGDLHAFAADAPVSKPGPVPATETASGEKPDSAGLKEKGLITLEEVYTGMLEAEQVRASAARADPAVDNTAMAEKWGVQILSVSYAADGFWLAFRFRVIDPIKANVLFDTKIKPYLESEKSGVRLGVPTAAKIGSLRTTNRGHNVKAGKIYNIMFSNPGFQVQIGQRVTVVAGDFRVAHLTVRGSRENLSINESTAQ